LLGGGLGGLGGEGKVLKLRQVHRKQHKKRDEREKDPYKTPFSFTMMQRSLLHILLLSLLTISAGRSSFSNVIKPTFMNALSTRGGDDSVITVKGKMCCDEKRYS
jgi:hypothetical protein